MNKGDKQKSNTYNSKVSSTKENLEATTSWIGAFAKIYSSVFGIGFIKGGGTVAALFCCLCIYGCWQFGIFSNIDFIVATAILTFAGIWSGNVVEPQWGKDSSKVVIDEVSGMCISLLFVPINLFTLIAGFVLFRFFDILKPLGIRRMEVFTGGWGVMADDALAGVYANIVLHGIIIFVKPSGYLFATFA